MNNLSLYPAHQIDQIVWPADDYQLDNQSSALNVFTDFSHHLARVITAQTLADDAIAAMRIAHVRLKLVVDRDQAFVGIVCASDMAEEEILKRVAEGTPRNELTVADFMQSREQLAVLDYQELAKSTIADIANVLQANGRQHVLVADSDRVHLRGIISASDIARRLKIPVSLGGGTSFVAIFQALKARA